MTYHGTPLEDTRSDSAKQKDYLREEVILAGSARPWTNKKVTRLTVKEKNQFGTSSCVAHAILTQLEYENLLTTDPSDLALYRKRANYSGEGSNGEDILNKARHGLSTYKDIPTPNNATEAYANALPLVLGSTLLNKPFKYYQYDASYRPDASRASRIIADVARGKAVVVFYYSTNAEARREYMEPTDTKVTLQNASVRHAVTLIPKGDFTENGKHWASMQDSAKFGNRAIHYVSEEFLEERVYWAAIVTLDEEAPAPTPQPALPNVICEFGERSQAVHNLQGWLIQEGYLAPQYQTGLYGRITSDAVLWAQLERFEHFKKRGASIPQLLEWKGHWWGRGSIEAINQ